MRIATYSRSQFTADAVVLTGNIDTFDDGDHRHQVELGSVNLYAYMTPAEMRSLGERLLVLAIEARDTEHRLAQAEAYDEFISSVTS